MQKGNAFSLILIRSLARLHHLADDLHQGPILQRSRDSLLISELLVDLVAGTVSALLNPHVYAKARRERLL
jgi:hypothetical protein